MSNTHSAPTVLRRVATPYVGQMVILAAVTSFSAYVAINKSEWGLLSAAALIWALFLAYVLMFGMPYRVSWNEAGVTMTASGGPKRTIGFDEITKVWYEAAGADEFLSQSRPFCRIVLLGDPRDLDEKIDVSLRHFRAEDIDRLLTEIRARRPDLKLPATPLFR